MDKEKYDLADSNQHAKFFRKYDDASVDHTSQNLQCLRMKLVRPDSLVIISRQLSFTLPKKTVGIRIGRE